MSIHKEKGKTVYIWVQYGKFNGSAVAQSVVECLTRDREATGLNFTGVAALWSLSKTHLS